jgi:hypothetical protein
LDVKVMTRGRAAAILAGGSALGAAATRTGAQALTTIKLATVPTDGASAPYYAKDLNGKIVASNGLHSFGVVDRSQWRRFHDDQVDRAAVSGDGGGTRSRTRRRPGRAQELIYTPGR